MSVGKSAMAATKTRTVPRAARRVSICRGLLTLCVALTGIGAGSSALGAWPTYLVDDQTPDSNGIGLAAQATGQVHIGYTFKPGQTARYATNAYGVTPWTMQTIDTIAEAGSGKITGQLARMAVDSRGNIHSSFSNSYWPGIMYATNASGTWVPTQIESGAADAQSALAIDADDGIHILTVDASGNLDCWSSPVPPASEWTKATLPDSGIKRVQQIVMDSNRHTHAVYFADGDLRYATNASGTWASEVVTAALASAVSSPVALALDVDRHAHIVYLDDTGHALRYVTNVADGIHWNTEKIEDEAPGASIAACVTTDGTTRLPTVDLFNLATGALGRAVRDDVGSWKTNPQDTVTGVAADASLVTDASGKIHLAYIDAAARNLHYVTDAVARGADVSVTQTRLPAVIAIGQEVQYTVTVTNLGADTASSVVLTDVLPAGSTFVSASHGVIDPDDSGQVLWNIGDMSKGDSVTTVITVQAANTAGTMTNRANVSCLSNQDFKSANDSASITDPITVPQHQLLFVVVGNAGGTLAAANGLSMQDQGSVVNVVATPDPGFQVKSWQGTIDDTSKANTNAVLIGSGDKTTISVQFERIQRQLTAMVVGGHGTINPNAGIYDSGVTVTLTAKPDRHYAVKTWTGTDNDAGAEPGNKVTMDQDRVVKVEFRAVPNQAPVPVIDVSGVAHPGDLVVLDGSASYDPDGDPITWKWEQTDVKTVTLADPTTSKATFIAPDIPAGLPDTTLTFKMTVTDDSGLPAANTATVKIIPASQPCGPCGCGVGAPNMIGFYALCWMGLACMKWAPRPGRAAKNTHRPDAKHEERTR
jgi:uncharacterized repeat protein (TIGR01451 family)